jgi:hypothetical protein
MIAYTLPKSVRYPPQLKCCVARRLHTACALNVAPSPICLAAGTGAPIKTSIADCCAGLANRYAEAGECAVGGIVGRAPAHCYREAQRRARCSSTQQACLGCIHISGDRHSSCAYVTLLQSWHGLPIGDGTVRASMHL